MKAATKQYRVQTEDGEVNVSILKGCIGAFIGIGKDHPLKQTTNLRRVVWVSDLGRDLKNVLPN